MKRFLATFFFAIIALSTWAYDVEIDGIYYNLNSSTKEAEVTYLSENDYSNRYAYSGEIVIPETITFKNTEIKVTSIGDYAFQECYDLTSVTIPNSVTSIGDYAFDECTSLTSVTIPNSVASIGCWAFGHCTGLTSVTIPNSVTSIGNYAFEECTHLTSVEIPNSVTSIGNEAFYNCYALKSVTIPNSVTSIGNYAFRACSGLTSITVEEGNAVYDSRNNCNALIETASNTLIAGCMNTIIPNSVTSIGYEAFYNCYALKSVTIPNSVTSIGNYAFRACSGLTSITVEEGNAVYDSRNNCNALIETASNTLIAGCMNTIIPNSVTSIGYYAFRYCSNVKELIYARGCTTALRTGLTSITSVEIPNSVTSIEDDAFENCSDLTSVNISSLEAWCNIAFSDYSSNPLGYAHHLYLNDVEVKYLVIPESVMDIKNYAFLGCSGLTSVKIHNSVTSIGYEAFKGCTSLPVIDNIRYADTYLVEAVDKTLSEYNIKSDTRFIGSYAFYNCTGLTSVTIPNSVTSIGNEAFESCKGLTSVTNYATTPQSISSNVFYNVTRSNVTLYVPMESVDAYKAAEVWKEFNIEGMTDGIESLNAKADANTTKRLENGRVIIEKDGQKFSAAGQRIE